MVKVKINMFEFDFWSTKLTLKNDNIQFLTVFNQKVLQGIKKSSWEAHSNAKINQKSTAPLRNSTTVTMIMYGHAKLHFACAHCKSKIVKAVTQATNASRSN